MLSFVRVVLRHAGLDSLLMGIGSTLLEAKRALRLFAAIMKADGVQVWQRLNSNIKLIQLNKCRLQFIVTNTVIEQLLMPKLTYDSNLLSNFAQSIQVD